MSTIIIVLCLPLLFFLWCGIHEVAHIVAAKSYTKLSNVRFKLYPHINSSLGLVWASVSWKPERRLTLREFAWVSIAPRFPDALAVVLFPLWALMPNTTLMLIWGGVWGAGLVDLFVGSLGISKRSDLRRAAEGWEWNPWILRINGMVAILISAVAGIMLFLYASPDQVTPIETSNVDIEIIAPTSQASCDPNIHKYPNSGLTECKSSAECVPGMTRVEGFCIDRFEASLLKADDTHWSPYHRPGKDDVVRAVSLLGAVPQGYIDGLTASRACKLSGKRLCTSKEWLRACQGKSQRTFPYGNKRQPGICNDARKIHPALELFGNHKSSFQKIQNACINQLPNGLDLTGNNPLCVTEESVYDMMGNLHEWVSDKGGIFRGGYYVDTYRNGPGCLYRTMSHSMGHWDYSTGFRCCKAL